MRPIATLILMASSVSSVAGRPAPADEPKGDMAKLQGSWTAKVGSNNQSTMVVTVKGKTVEQAFTGPGGKASPIVSSEMTVDETANPKTFDWTNTLISGGNKLPPNLGIYKLDGDSWTICVGGVNRKRPAEFKAGEVDSPRLTTFTRVKEKADDKALKGDLAKIQGTWLASVGPNDDVVITMVVKVNAYTAKWDQGDGTTVELKGEVRMNEKATPRTIDFFNTHRNDGEDARDSLGIYEFDGDKLKFCVGGGGEERPTEFKRGSDGTPHLMTFARKKD